MPGRTSSARAQCLAVCESVALLFFSREARDPDFYVQSSDFLVLATGSDLIFFILFYFGLVFQDMASFCRPDCPRVPDLDF